MNINNWLKRINVSIRIQQVKGISQFRTRTSSAGIAATLPTGGHGIGVLRRKDSAQGIRPRPGPFRGGRETGWLRRVQRFSRTRVPFLHHPGPATTSYFLFRAKMAETG